MKLLKIEIEKFRHMESQIIEFGDALTVISGLNGTGKSTILGLAGHFFVTPNSEIKTIAGKDFQTKQSEVFRLCDRHDYDNKYFYSGYWINDDKTITKMNVSTRHLENPKRLKFDIDGRGNKFKYPVIYLGLKRLFPNASETKFNITNCDLSAKEKKFYIDEIKNIMLVNNNQNDVERVITTNKNYLGIKTNNYGAAGNSAGQDNIGQIMSAILSFKKLPKIEGILLIDELEATLFPAAQINLLDKLYKYAKNYNLQIIFTTHSLEILKQIKLKKWSDAKINFLELKNHKVINTIDPEFEYIEHKIKAEAIVKKLETKKQILCEDEVAAYWVKNLLKNTDLKNKIDINYKGMNNGCIGQLAKSKAKCFEKFIFILDGDCKDKTEYKNIKNILFLPGSSAPEIEIYNFLKQLKDDDEFWNNQYLFDYNACFNRYMDDNIDTNRCKNWFEASKPFLGKDLSRFFTRWKKDNQETVNNFVLAIKKKI